MSVAFDALAGQCDDSLLHCPSSRCSAAADESGPTTTGDSSESGQSSETDTGEDSPPDACPASPVLAQLSTKFDDYEVGYDYPDGADWDEPCTVVADQGELVGGQTITLACTPIPTSRGPSCRPSSAAASASKR